MMKTVPQLKAGYFFTLVGTVAESRKLVGKYFLAVREEPFVYVTNEGDDTEFDASVATGGESGSKDITALKPNENQLYFVKPGVKDGCDYYMKIPSGHDRWGVSEDVDVGHIDNEVSPYCDPSDEYSFWLIEDMYPAFIAVNNSGKSLTPKVYFQGIKFDYEEVKAKPQQFSVITLGGIK